MLSSVSPATRNAPAMNCELFSSFTPYVRGSCAGIGWRDTRKRDNYFEISTALFVGTDADNPGNDRVPAAHGAGTGKPPTVVVTKGQVEMVPSSCRSLATFPGKNDEYART